MATSRPSLRRPPRSAPPTDPVSGAIAAWSFPVALGEAAAIVAIVILLLLVRQARAAAMAALDRQSRIVAALEEQSMHIRHEFLNGAARMGVYIRRIEDGGEPIGAVAAGAIEAIERERRTLVASTEAILRLSRLRTGERQTRVEDLALLAGEVVDMLEARAEDKAIRLSTALQPATTLGDSAMLAMTLSNIIGNAIKYTPSGGAVHVATGIAGETAIVTVDDSGPGIPAALRDTVFLPRLRVESTADEAGHGYGLAIAMAAISQHRGRIMIDDSPLGGARFTITLAACPAD